MTYLPDTQDPAIRDALMLVADALTEIEDKNLYERQGTSAVDDAQYVLAMAVRNQHKDMRRAARQLVDVQIDRSPLVAADAMEEAA